MSRYRLLIIDTKLVEKIRNSVKLKGKQFMKIKVSKSFDKKDMEERYRFINNEIREFERKYPRKENYSLFGGKKSGMIAYSCPHCNSIVYGTYMYKAYPKEVLKSFTSTNCYNFDAACQQEKIKLENKLSGVRNEEMEALRKDVLRVKNMQVCPLCGNSLSNEYGYYKEYGFERDFGDTFDFIEANTSGLYDSFWDFSDNYYASYVLNELEKEKTMADKKKIEEKIENKIVAYDIYVPEISSEKIEKTRDSLKKHVKNLLGLELNIFALSKRLKELYSNELQCKRQVNQSKFEMPSKEKPEKDLAVAEKKYNDLLKVYEAKKAVVVNTVDVPFPKEPTKPGYIKEGLFNKKKVQEENEKLKKQYEEELKVYELEYTKAKELQEKLTLEKKQNHDEEVHRLHHKLLEAKNEVSEAQQVLDSIVAIEKAPDELIIKAYSMVDTEIKNAEELLEKMYRCRNELYAYDIVFSKYRNPVALASFYEYLSAGRCDSLEGANGAYNIYETECRANLIVSKLSQVIETLEEIKENQYMIYAALNDIDSSLGKLNSTMGKAVNSLTNIENGVTRIADNSDVIAYNTQVTAYYSKMNAELTNSLGYMVALS